MTRSPRGARTSWEGYVRGFHTERPGITEAILRHVDTDDDPYAWLASAVPGRARVLDVACGSGPLRAHLPGRRWIGLDRSAAELSVARAAGALSLVRADATAIPLGAAVVDAVTCSMGLMVITPLTPALAEMARVLRPGGRLVATIPAGGPLRAADRAVAAGLVAALGAAPGYPAGDALPRIASLLTEPDWSLISDERRRFGYPLGDSGDADRLLDSLYLPDVSSRRYRLARGYLRTLAGRGVSMPIPLRRLVAERRETR